MNFNVQDGKKTVNITHPTDLSVQELKEIYSKMARKDINRLSFKFGQAKLDEKSLKASGVVEGSILTMKDLGPQIGYRTVFLSKFVVAFSSCFLMLFHGLLQLSTSVQ
jgi:hypothetical protein